MTRKYRTEKIWMFALKSLIFISWIFVDDVFINITLYWLSLAPPKENHLYLKTWNFLFFWNCLFLLQLLSNETENRFSLAKHSTDLDKKWIWEAKANSDNVYYSTTIFPYFWAVDVSRLYHSFKSSPYSPSQFFDIILN